MEDHFGLERSPFRLGPDASFYYEAEAHRRAMAHLRYGLRQGEGFVVITGEPGVGKTMVIEQLLLSVRHTDVLARMLVPNGLTRENLAERVLAAFDRRVVDNIDPTQSFRDYLTDERRRGAKVSLIIDEAQLLSDVLLEELRLLSDLTEDGEPLLQICLVGQTALRRVLFRDDMEQLRQRIVASYHLAPLNADETEAYVRHRMKVAGHEGPAVFTEDSIGAVYRISGGVPRRINSLCGRLLGQAAAEHRDTVTVDDAQGAADGSVQVDATAPPSDTPSEGRHDETVPAPPARGAAGARPSLTVVENVTATDEVRPTQAELDEEAEAERTLALVTAPPPTSLQEEAERQARRPPRPPRRPADAGHRSFPVRAQGGGAQRSYPVSVSEINAAIQSIQAQAPAVEEPIAPVVPSEPDSRPRMVSPQELMKRKAQTAVRPSVTDKEVSDPPRAEPMRTGAQEEAVYAFLSETESTLVALREALETLRERVDWLDRQRRARRNRIEQAVEEAKARLDELRLER